MRDLSSLVISLFGAMEMALLKLILWGLKSGNGIVKTDLFKSGIGFVETDFMGIKIWKWPC